MVEELRRLNPERAQAFEHDDRVRREVSELIDTSPKEPAWQSKFDTPLQSNMDDRAKLHDVLAENLQREAQHR